MEEEEGQPFFSKLSEDILINIFAKLEEEDDPRYLALTSCVCTRFNNLIQRVCWKRKCMKSMPTVVADLLQQQPRLEAPPGGWAALHRVAVCCPGLWHAGILLENSDLGLERDIGPSDQYLIDIPLYDVAAAAAFTSSSTMTAPHHCCSSTWSLVDDLEYDLGFNFSYLGYEALQDPAVNAVGNGSEQSELQHINAVPEAGSSVENGSSDRHSAMGENDGVTMACRDAGQSENKRKELEDKDLDDCNLKKKKMENLIESHLANGPRNLTREQGNKLLASRFRADSLYICDWPGCVHAEEKRNYRIFRGVFKNFKKSYVWRNIRDSKAKKTFVNCAFCFSKGTWDMLNTFCLKRSLGYHDDGEPSVRAFVCDNGHVAGAWTDSPVFA